MPSTITGNESNQASSGYDLTKGARTTLKRWLKDYDNATGRESTLDVSAATEITWKLLTDMKAGTVATLTKTLSGATITRPNTGTDGQIQVVIDDSDLSTIDLGYYYSHVVVTIGGEPYEMRPAVVCVRP